MTDRVHLGFEVGSGTPVSVPLHHAIVSGVTGLSGKTTAISAMLSRQPDGYKSLVFSTKRGEISFEGAHEVQPFYKATVDWEYVSGVLEAARKEKLKFERSWIIKASRGATSLRDVYENIIAALEGDGKPLRGLDESVWTVLRAYFEKVLPELESQPWASSLDLAQGVNVMRLEHLSEEVQGLVIAASLEEAHRAMSNVVLVIPEAWLYVPQQRGSPVKWAAQHIIRQGRARGVFLWLDSQDVTGISKDVLKSVDLWVLGRQREINEVRRLLDQLPATQKPKPSDVMTLGVGQFYVAAEDWLKLVYVQPQWLDEDQARQVALGQLKPSDVVPVLPSPSKFAVLENTEQLPEPVSTGQSPEAPISPVEEDPMMITDLRVQLANAEIQRNEFKRQIASLDSSWGTRVATLEKQVATERTAGNRAREAEQANSRALEQMLHRCSALEAGMDIFEHFRDALREFLSLDSPSGSLQGPSAHLELDALADKVAARLGAGRPVVQVVALETLKHQFQQDTVDRLAAQVQALEERPRQAILWLLSVGRPAKHQEICRGLGFPLAGGAYVKFGIGIKEVVAAGILDHKEDGLHVTIRDKVVAALASYNPTTDDIEATYQHLVAALANEAGERSEDSSLAQT